MRCVVVLLVLMLGCSLFVFSPSVAADEPWWDDDWDFYKSITIDHTQVNDTMINFPILINITDGDLADHAQDDGDDIVFVNSTHTGTYAHEIELFDGETGRLVAWVNITLLSGAEDTVFYMYYGNDVCGGQQDPTGVWDSDFMAVWHFNESSGTHYDSTSNNNDIVSSQNVLYQQDALFGYGLLFSGALSWAVVPFTANMDGEVTIDMLIKTDVYDQEDFLWCNENNVVNVYNFLLLEWAIKGLCNPNGYLQGDENPVSTSRYYQISYALNEGGISRLYIDGYENDAKSTPSMGQHGSVGTQHYLGTRYYSGQYRSFDGMMEEVRISNVQRSTHYARTVYNNMNNATDGGFFTMGVETMPDTGETPWYLELSYETYPCYATNISFVVIDPEGNDITYNVTINDEFFTGIVGNNTLVICNLSHYLMPGRNYTCMINITDGENENNTIIYILTEDSFCDCLCIQEGDTVLIEFGAEILMLVVFMFFLWIGYVSEKRSSGAFLLTAGFMLLYLEVLLSSYTGWAAVLMFFSPLAIFVILLGIKKLLYGKMATSGQETNE